MPGHEKADSNPDVSCELTLQFPPPPPSASPQQNLNHAGARHLLPRGDNRARSDYPYSPRRRNPTQKPVTNKPKIIRPPFVWAADHRATVLSLWKLKANGITEIHGEIQCKHCEARSVIKHDLASKFKEVYDYIASNVHLMHDRAPERWTSPTYPDCIACNHSSCMKPVIADKKRSINWLFLFLGQWLGCCTLEQLKYFCKHTMNHRTGAKDRVLYLAYITIRDQLVNTNLTVNS